MLTSDLMTRPVQCCLMTDTLERVALRMWDADVGALPVVDQTGCILAMITDRDICMAAYTQGKPLREMPASVAASHHVHGVHPYDLIESALTTMKLHRVRRVPVHRIGAYWHVWLDGVGEGSSMPTASPVRTILRTTGTTNDSNVVGQEG
jgi:signal-transduction protein with cAMP-binding, CBS, and nucleotidyltransferase domain